MVNYTEREIPYTGIIEHKHFEMLGQTMYDCPKMIVSLEGCHFLANAWPNISITIWPLSLNR